MRKTRATARAKRKSTSKKLYKQAKDEMKLKSSRNREFRINTEALRRCSEYFSGLLNSGMKETLNGCVTFPELSTQSLRYVAEFLKHGTISIVKNDFTALSEAAHAASYLLITDLMKVITDIIVSWLTVENFDTLKDIVDQLVLIDTQLALNEWALRNGTDYLASESFLKRSLMDVKKILSSDDLLIDDEIEVVTAATNWAEKNNCSEELCFARTLLMNALSLSKYMRKAKSKKHKKLFGSAFRENRSFHVPEQFHMAHLDARLRCEDTYVITVGGFSIEPGFRDPRTPSAIIQIVPIKELRDYVADVRGNDVANGTVAVKHLRLHASEKEKLPKGQFDHQICILDNDIYVIGGRYDTNLWTNKVFRFNVSTRKWQELCHMLETRKYFYAGVLCGKIYAVSGSGNRTVEAYDPVLNKWYYVSKLNRFFAGHAGSVLNNKLYISGGSYGIGEYPNKVCAFDPFTTEHDLGEWMTDLAPMNMARMLHVMVPVGNRGLLVAGGVESHGDITRERQCEFYDVQQNQWTLLESRLSFSASCMSHIVDHNKLIVFGGYSRRTEHRVLQIIDLETFKVSAKVFASDIVKFPCGIVNLPLNYARNFLPK